MAKENRHSQAVPTAIIEQAKAALQSSRDQLNPHMPVVLTAQDRRRMPILGPKTMDFVGLALEIASTHPTMLPPHVALEDFKTDYDDAVQFASLQTMLETYLEKVTDQGMAAGSEALQAALAVYAAVKLAADQKIEDAKVLQEKLKSKYPGRSRRTAASEHVPEPTQQ